MKSSIILMVSILAITVAVYAEETTVSAPTTTPKPRRKITKVKYNATEYQQECSMRVLKFTNVYLRGVKYPNLISFNETTFKQCQKLCCYEQRFECKSLSYFKPLRQCFLMNLTRHNRKVELIKNAGYVHVQIMPEVEMTTMSWDPEETTQSLEEDIATTTSAIRQTTKPTIDVSTASWDHTPMDTTTQSEYLGATGPSDEYEEGSEDGNNGDNNSEGSGTNYPSGGDNEAISTTKPASVDLGPDDGILEEPAGPKGPGKIISTECFKDCGSNGKCFFREKEGNSTAKESYCECDSGFVGDACETKKVEEDVLAPWIIAIIVIGALILILIIVACVLLQIYKKNKGEYKVVEQFRRWARRGKKPKKPDNDDEIAHMDDDSYENSPTASAQHMSSPDESATRTAV